MKGALFVLIFLILASSVLAMNDPINVKTQPGNEVKIYAWTSGTGPLLTSNNGIANENGTFETTFYSLNVPTYRLWVLIIDPKGTKIKEGKFADMTTDGPIFVDCTSNSCEVSADEEIEETVVIENESIVENTNFTESDFSIKEKLSGIILTGKVIFIKEDGSISWIYSTSGFIVLLCLVVFIFGMLRHGKTKETPIVLDEDEKELQETEKEVKEIEDKINSVKTKQERKIKLENAKRKLAEEQEELRKLENDGDSSKTEEQKSAVDSAKDEVDTAQDNLS